MDIIVYFKTIKDRIKLRLMLDKAADLRRDEALADRTSEAWIKLRQRRIDMQLQAFLTASRLLAHGVDVSRPASKNEIRAVAAGALAAAVIALNALVQIAKAIA